MIPILYDANEKSYGSNGLGRLVDAGYCIVTNELNGKYELELQYPVNGIHYNEIAVDRQIYAKADQSIKPQPFRIYYISKPMNGIVIVRAEHISYQLSSIIVTPFSSTSAVDAVEKIKTNSISNNPFTITTDIDSSSQMSLSLPYSARSILGGVRGSFIDTYGGYIFYDHYDVTIKKESGQYNGFNVSYSKNLTGIECVERLDGVVTGALAFWTKETEGIERAVYGELQTVEHNLSYSRDVLVDCSEEFEDAPSVETLNEYAREYINTKNNVPYFSVSVEFVNLGDTEEYKTFKDLYKVAIGDIVLVEHIPYRISVRERVVTTVYDSIKERFSKIEIGEARGKLAKTITNQARMLNV